MTANLTLTRPLVSFDIESTGLDTRTDRIIEISCVKRFPDDSRETLTHRINPEQPISPDAIAVHHITDDDVRDMPPFREVAEALWHFMVGADLTGFNIESFDIPMLREEFKRCDLRFPEGHVHIIDSCRIFHRHEPRDLSAALKFYCQKELTAAHSAEADATASLDILEAQVLRYDDLPNDTSGLDAWCHPVQPNWLDSDGRIVWRDGHAALGFGKHRNRTLRAMAIEDPDYLRWMANANFSERVRHLCRDALDGEFPTRGDTADQEQRTEAQPLLPPAQLHLGIAPKSIKTRPRR